jgi:hypothetical protein
VVNNVVLFLGLNPCGDKLFLPHFDGVLEVGLLLHVGPRLVYDIFLDLMSSQKNVIGNASLQ